MLWIAQNVALWYVGESLAWPLRYRTKNPIVRWTGRAMIQVTWVLLLVCFPWLIGTDPISYFARAYPTPPPWGSMCAGFLIMFGVGLTFFLGEWSAGWVRIHVRVPARRFLSKFLRRPLTAVALPVMEESVFRGVVLEQLLVALPSSRLGQGLAVSMSGAIFSSVHFLRARHAGAPLWRPAWGLFLVGCVLGAIYVHFDRTLWLAIAIHAGAILLCEWSRLLYVYQAPPWLIGYPECPQSGVIGSTGMILVGAIVLWFH